MSIQIHSYHDVSCDINCDLAKIYSCCNVFVCSREHYHYSPFHLFLTKETTTLNVTTASPTIAATTAARVATTAASAATTAASAATTAASVATTAASAATTVTTTTAEAVTTAQLTFRSPAETFTSDLLVPSSAAFQTRAALLVSTIGPFYKEAFPSFRTITVNSFSNGSIIQIMGLGFSSTSAPNVTLIGNVLVEAASNISAFSIDINSISVDGTKVSSGVSHKISLTTACFLVLMSWILSSQQ
ncbi:hypothetical protein EYF80_004564 [Liparis tanakae]|uniref:SEA domain-containing protein n=1 Tax=Liparis tanakae TaxID=230148 RepID=A0A4Z2J5S1_9TELE|nr:hypothetical protein EYF80_004564 [Liparis tanakae]